jgi:Kinesin motor domain
MANNTRQGSKEKVRVVCRIRPQNNKELLLSTHGVCIKTTSEQQLDIVVNDESHIFQFDRVFGMDSDQISVFEYTAIPLIHDVLNGYNATIFAYGQTGTMQLLRLKSAAFLSILNHFLSFTRYW